MTVTDTYCIKTESGNAYHIVFHFDSDVAEEHAMVDGYDECYVPVQRWLDRHFPGEQLTSNGVGEDIERSGGPATNDDALDFRTKPPK